MAMHVPANEHTVLTRGDDAMVLAGVNDRSAPAGSHRSPDLDAPIAGAPAGAPIVLLDQQPKNALQAAARGVALIVRAHA